MPSEKCVCRAVGQTVLWVSDAARLQPLSSPKGVCQAALRV